MPTPKQQEVLKRFYDDGEMSQVVLEFLLMHLDSLALERVYANGMTVGLADAKEVIESAFNDLDNLFEPVNPKKELDNESR